MILGLGHAARTGKDTIAGILVADHGFRRLAFADALRKVVYDSRPDIRKIVNAYGWEYAKTIHPPVREALVDLGNAAREHLGADVWIRAVAEQIPYDDSRWVITDVRYPNEANAIKLWGGVLVRVRRPGVEPLPNVADQGLINFAAWDTTIDNDGTIEDLKVKVAELVAKCL